MKCSCSTQIVENADQLKQTNSKLAFMHDGPAEFCTSKHGPCARMTCTNQEISAENEKGSGKDEENPKKFKNKPRG